MNLQLVWKSQKKSDRWYKEESAKMGWDEPVLLRAISKDLSEERMFKVKPKK